MKKTARTPIAVPTLIAKKRDGGALTDGEIEAVITGAVRGSIPDYQLAALLMAMVWRGLGPRELETWTRAMIDSGERLDWSSLPGRTVDKHSTGGVGDKVSLCLAPALRRGRPLRPDDGRARARPHRRHARQAGDDPRLSHGARTGRLPARARPGRIRAGRAERPAGPR